MDEQQALIVVVEDDSSLRRALERLLVAAGYRTRVFDSAEALLTADGHRGAACLVLDIALPGRSGIDLYAALGPGRPPAVLITANDSATQRNAAEIAGASSFLPKPFVGRALLTSVARAIELGATP